MPVIEPAIEQLAAKIERACQEFRGDHATRFAASMTALTAVLGVKIAESSGGNALAARDGAAMVRDHVLEHATLFVAHPEEYATIRGLG